MQGLEPKIQAFEKFRLGSNPVQAQIFIFVAQALYCFVLDIFDKTLPLKQLEIYHDFKFKLKAIFRF